MAKRPKQQPPQHLIALPAPWVEPLFQTLQLLGRHAWKIVLAFTGPPSLVPIAEAMAGRHTTAMLGAHVAGLDTLKPLLWTGGACVVLLFVAAGAMIWAIVERRLRYRTLADISAENKALEERIDPRRSSSRLAPTGRPLDEGA